MRDVMEKPRDDQGNRKNQALHLLDTPSNNLVADFAADCRRDRIGMPALGLL
jgi:hypothetical protein